MACLREQTSKGRGRVIQCDEEGCKLRSVAIISGSAAIEAASSSDCLLQFRLRAGDTPEWFEDAIDPDAVRKAVDDFDRNPEHPHFFRYLAEHYGLRLTWEQKRCIENYIELWRNYGK